jgi:hypothetical protein
MKKSMILLFGALAMATVGFSQQPTPATEQAIAVYLKTLQDSNSGVRLEALKKLNDLKTQYPNLKMKEFDKFMTSKIMEKSTQSIINNLASENSGVRHSTLHILVRLKSDYPNLDLSVFNSALSKMSNQDPAKHLQVDAKIASIFLNDTELASNIKIDEAGAPGDSFNQIHLEMEKAFSTENPEPK